MKKSVSIFLIVLVLFVTQIARAQTPCYPNPSVGCITDANLAAEETQVMHMDGAGTYSMGVAVTAIANSILSTPQSDGTLPEQTFQRSLVGQVTKGVSYAYTVPPASLALWVNETGQNLGFIPKSTYAQGAGFSALSPILNIWRAFRNIAYILLAGVLIVIGFMIMFRRKIDPHTVVTIQNALPRVIITLILITFSYPIAALMLELMYISLYLIISVISSGFGENIQELQNIYIQQGDATALLGRMMAPLSEVEGGAGALTALLGGTALNQIMGLPGFLLGAIGGLVVTSFVSTVGGGDPLSAFISPILWLVFAVVIFFFFFRILFILIGSYIQILLGIITAPLQILMNVFPGNNSFQSWLMTLIGNLGTFVVVAAMLMINGAILSNIQSSGTLWAPPLVGGVNTNLLKMFIGVGGLMLIPSIVNSFKQMIQAGGGLAAGSAAAGSVGGGIGAIMQIAHVGTSLDHLSGGQIGKMISGNKEH